MTTAAVLAVDVACIAIRAVVPFASRLCARFQQIVSADFDVVIVNCLFLYRFGRCGISENASTSNCDQCNRENSRYRRIAALFACVIGHSDFLPRFKAISYVPLSCSFVGALTSGNEHAFSDPK